MSRLTRRHTLLGLGALAVMPSPAFAQIRARIVIIGGGFGGATAAQTLRSLAPHLDITLIEPKKSYWACPFSNLVLSGDRDMRKQRFDYVNLKSKGIKVIESLASDIDPINRDVKTTHNTSFKYDKLILSPGISMQWGAIEGYDEAAANILPHAWQAGPQTELLKQQLDSLENGGTVAISVPKAPYRCPPGPYERASLIAHYLKTRKPKSKLLIFDSKDSFSKQSLFKAEWAERYKDILEWRNYSNDGSVIKIDSNSRTLFTDFDSLSVDVANIIPPQKAGEIASRAGVTDSTGWCPVDGVTFESRLQKNIYIIGDACIANPMPKSAFSAAQQAKICAMQILRTLSGQSPLNTTLTNTCYSYTSPNEAVSITGVYRAQNTKISAIPNAGGLSSLKAGAKIRREEAKQAEAWFLSATKEAFG